MKLEKLLDIEKLNEQVRDGYISVRAHPKLPLRIYNYSSQCTFENKWSLESCICRGLIVDSNDNVVSRPIAKFFNLGQTGPLLVRDWFLRDERGENKGVVKDQTIDPAYLLECARLFKNPITITRKLDGWAGISWHYEGIYGVASRGSFDSPGAQYATEKVQKFVKYGAFADFLPEDTTLFFEIISKVTKVVVPYNFEGLVLIAAIANETGEELEYPELEAFHKQLNSYAKDRDWCRLVPKFDMSVEECMADKDMTEEGYVTAVHRPHLPPVRAKIKLAEYCRLHRIVTGVTPQKIWNELSDPMSPWISHNSKKDWTTGEIKVDMSVPKEFGEWVYQWQVKITGVFHEKLVRAVEAESHLTKLATDSPAERKAQVEWLRANFADVSKAAMLLHQGKIVDAYNELWIQVRPFGREEYYYQDGKGE